MKSTWGADAFRGVPGRQTGGRGRRIFATIGLMILSAGLVMLVVFTAGGRGIDEVMIAVGASVATIFSFAAVRVVQSTLAYRDKPRLDVLRESQFDRLGEPAVPAPLERITAELKFSRTSLRYYRRVLSQRLRRLAVPLGSETVLDDEEAVPASPLDDQINAAGERGSRFSDKLPERITRRGVPIERISALIDAAEAVRHGNERR